MNGALALYKEQLATIANTRLIYNTIEELEAVLENHSIRSNGVKRCYPTLQKARSTFRDLHAEATLMTNGSVLLHELLPNYKKASDFYRKHLARRSNNQNIASQLLQFWYPPHNKPSDKKAEIFNQITEQNIDPTLLLLMLLKALPSYHSKEGNADNFGKTYNQVLDFLEQFTSCHLFTSLPAITVARAEKRKSRLMLYYHTSTILDIFASYANPAFLYDTSANVKSGYLHLELAGFWNEYGGENNGTNFWQMEPTEQEGIFFATHWRKSADKKLTGIRYSMTLNHGKDGSLIVYIYHPKAINRLLAGSPYQENDHAWYKTEIPTITTPTQLQLQRAIPLTSESWQPHLSLTRVTATNTIEIYEQWLRSCEIAKPYQDCEYLFFVNLYAITEQHLYIPTLNAGEYYRVPRNAFEGGHRIQMGDKVGTIQLGNKVYLAFDELLLFIEDTPHELNRYQIEKVNRIE